MSPLASLKLSPSPSISLQILYSSNFSSPTLLSTSELNNSSPSPPSLHLLLSVTVCVCLCHSPSLPASLPLPPSLPLYPVPSLSLSQTSILISSRPSLTLHYHSGWFSPIHHSWITKPLHWWIYTHTYAMNFFLTICKVQGTAQGRLFSIWGWSYHRTQQVIFIDEKQLLNTGFVFVCCVLKK